MAENSEAAAAVEPEAEGRPAMSCMEVAGLSREELKFNGKRKINHSKKNPTLLENQITKKKSHLGDLRVFN